MPLTSPLCQSMAIYLEIYTDTDNKLHAAHSVFLTHSMRPLG